MGDIGNIKSVNTTSMGLNGEGASGAARKPITSGGNASPGGTKPMRVPNDPVPMPKAGPK